MERAERVHLRLGRAQRRAADAAHLDRRTATARREVITPRGIARGEGDATCSRSTARSPSYGEPIYVRLLAEMNQTNNGYCAYNRDGSSRGAVALHERVQGRLAARDADPARRPGRRRSTPSSEAQAAAASSAPRGRAAGSRRSRWLWVPQTEGTPNTAANRAAAYWPGRRVRRLGRHRLLLPLPELREARALLRRLPEQAVRVRRVGAVGARRRRASCKQLLQLHQHATSACGCCSTTRATSPDGPFRLTRYPDSARAIRERAQEEALPRAAVTRQPAM